MKEFENYLKDKDLAENTMKSKLNYAALFLGFLDKENLKAEEVKYLEMLNFIETLNEKEKSKRLINIILNAVRNYYEYLKISNLQLKNPALNLAVKGVQRKIPENIIKYEILENIYRNFKTKSARDKRNKIIFGLFVYHGITTEELHKLKPEHIELKKAEIQISGKRKTNGRTLDLQGFQIIEMNEYLQKTRIEIIKNINKTRPARKPSTIDINKINNQLFISENGSLNLKNSLWHLFKDIRKENPEIKNAKQIRRSVIVHKLKTQNLREVQQFAGHKYVSSTERYLLNNIEDLKRETDKYHPLNNFK